MAINKQKEIELMSYEEAIAELSLIVELLESAEHPLDETIKLFERGQVLAQHCSQLLERAELKVKQLIGDQVVEMDRD